MKAYDLSSLDMLIIDYHKFSLSMMREVLRLLRVRNVVVAEDAQNAIKLAASIKPDLIFCDYEMSTMSGPAFMREVRSRTTDWDCRIPIIMLTSYTDNMRVITARDAGASNYLSKPFSVRAVYQRIIQIIEHPRVFIQNKNFIGPDRRRRKTDTFTCQDKRRPCDDIAESPNVSLSQDELNALLQEPA